MTEYENIYVNPWFKLYVQYCKGQKQHKYEYYPNPMALARRLRRLRQDFLGSGLPLNDLVQIDNRPIEETIKDLSDYLGDLTAVFLEDRHRNNIGCDVWCRGFFYYSIQLFAHGVCGSVDDLIQLAEAYERSSNIIHIIWTENLPKILSEEAGNWVMEHELAPTHLSECVTASIAVLLGVMEEPEMPEQ